MNNVIHLVKDQKFVLNLSKTDPEVQGVILYEKIADNHLDLYHTEVPKEYRGRGIGAILARAAIDYAIKEDIKVSLTCTYLEKFGRESLSAEELSRHVQP